MRILVTGASGQLGAYILRELAGGADHVTCWSGSQRGELQGHTLTPVDLANPTETEAAFAAARPDMVIHCGAISALGECHQAPQRARRINTEATTQLALRCQQHGTRFVFTSTDLVFDGEQGNYAETDAALPSSYYGQTKVAAELAVLQLDNALALRVSLMFGPALIARPTFFDQQLARQAAGQGVTLFVDEWRTPLDLETAAQSILIAARSPQTGILHIGGTERISRLEMGRQIAAAAGLDVELIEPVSRLSIDFAEPRPADTSLNCKKLANVLPNLPRPKFAEAVQRMLRLRDELR